ncbi:hypothetical protein [Burkholderia stagnalis]
MNLATGQFIDNYRADPKLVPDSVANVLTQIGAQVSTALREYNGNAMERTLSRWMAVVGVALKMPAGTVEITGSARKTIKALSQMFVENIADAGKAEGKPLSAQQVRQLTTYAERQVVGSFASGNLASFEEKAGRQAKSRMVVFITEGMENELKAISDPTKKVKVLAEKVTSPGSVREYRLLRARLSAPMVGTVSAGALAMIDGMCKFAGWKALLESEKKALSFQKTGQQDLRETLGGAMFVGSIAVGVGTVVKAYGTWRNLYATGMAERRAGEKLAARADIALRVVGVVNAVVWGVSAVMDLVDAIDTWSQKKWGLIALQGLSGITGLIAAGLAGWAAFATAGGGTMLFGLSLTGWGVVLAVVLVALGMLIDHIKGDIFSQWLERTYWGVLPMPSRYGEPKVEQSDFSKAMAGA